MPRLVRRQTLAQRITSALNPLDFLLWLSEEIETRELDSTAVGTQVGIAANFLFLLSRANTGRPSNADDDVFGDGAGQSWLSYLIQLLVWTSFSLSVANAAWVFLRKRHYRLFEANIEKKIETPSAQRVRVQSSPSSSSPLRILSDLISPESAESRAHPDSTRDVWELAIWDPSPGALALFSCFSPLHVLIYMFELPLDPLEPHPSVTVFKCLVLQVGLSAVMHLVQGYNNQRLKDTAIIQKEVFHEYDSKFVQPRLHPVVRDMGTQVSVNDIFGAGPGSDAKGLVETGRPTTTIIRRNFETHPNPNYLKHVDPDYMRPSTSSAASSSLRPRPSINFTTPRQFTPSNRPVRHSDSFTPAQSSGSRVRQSMPADVTPAGFATAAGTPATAMSSTGTNTNFGGSMGVFSHANSPLKKAISMNDIGSASGFHSPRNSRELAAIEQRDAAERIQRKASPIKEERFRSPEIRNEFNPSQPASANVNPFARPRSQAYKYERYPSRC